MTARSLELKKRWVKIAQDAGITTSALSGIRRGQYKPSAHTARALEDALQWGHGSIETILAGGDPTPLNAPEMTDSGRAADDLSVEREPTARELADRMSELTNWFKIERARDAQRIQRLEEEIERLRNRQSG
jgi:hypothetical protein